MLKRIITAVVAMFIFVPVVWFSDTYVFPVTIGIVCGIGLFEIFRCIGVLKIWGLSIPLIIGGAAMPIIARFFDGGRESDFHFVILGVAILMVLYIFAVSLFSKGKLPVELAGLTFMTEFYIAGGFTAIVLLRDFEKIGIYLFMLIFVGAWITDIFAYFVGRFFGKHKLIPEVSPKKTVEGSIGGTVFCALFFMLYGFVLTLFTPITSINYLVLAIVGVIISVVAQIGDLTMSQIKRKFGVKDYGKIMPGHGGVLDRFDSIIAVAFVLIIACATVRHFGINIFII